MHPITQCLPIHPPNARRDLPAHAIPDRSQRKQATRLVGVATCCSSLPKLLGTHPLFERNRHHAPRARISRIMGDGITAEDPEEFEPAAPCSQSSIGRNPKISPISNFHPTSWAAFWGSAGITHDLVNGET